MPKMTEQFVVTVPLILTFDKDIKYKEVQRLYKEIQEFLGSQEVEKATITLGKATMEKRTVY